MIFAPSASGESPPPPPRIFFGRDELIEKVVGSAEQLMPIALIGAGGIGKTSVALSILHDNRVKRQFGDDRRFIRCDKFPPSLPNFLRRLSKAIGAGVDNPEAFTPLRPFLSSRAIFIVLDNAESILDPHVASAQEIYGVVEELSQLSNIYLCITSRISTSPPEFERLNIPTLSKEAARGTFYQIYRDNERSDPIDRILKQLDFHGLSVTLLATVAHHNMWDTDRLTREWDERQTDILQTDHNKSLAATIELSLSSSTFQELGTGARDFLGVIAFFPQGVDEKKIDWLFPTIAGRKNMFDKFCVLSLAYRNEGFITMLAPIRDCISPRDPALAPLLCLTKERYFSRLSVDVEPGKPGFVEARWIVSEDVNIEHLLNVFTTIDATSVRVWDVCANFMRHIFWHKPRLVMLGPKIEALADGHPSKPKCFLRLSRLLRTTGNHAERKRLLAHAFKLSRERRNDGLIARVLRTLARVHLDMHLYTEGMRQAREAPEIYESLGDTTGRANCLIDLVWLLHYDGQLDAAQEAGTHAISLLSEEDEPFYTCRCHRALGNVYRLGNDTEKATHHFETALRIASSFNWLNQLFGVHYSLSCLCSDQGRFDEAHAHIERAKSYATSNHDPYSFASAVQLQAEVRHRQQEFSEAEREALLALDGFERLGPQWM